MVVLALRTSMSQLVFVADLIADGCQRCARVPPLHVSLESPGQSSNRYRDGTGVCAAQVRVLPVALRLAAGAEPVARQLFDPLITSLVHWLTRSIRRCPYTLSLSLQNPLHCLAFSCYLASQNFTITTQP
jgi:hypothetical protein